LAGFGRNTKIAGETTSATKTEVTNKSNMKTKFLLDQLEFIANRKLK